MSMNLANLLISASGSDGVTGNSYTGNVNV